MEHPLGVHKGRVQRHPQHAPRSTSGLESNPPYTARDGRLRKARPPLVVADHPGLDLMQDLGGDAGDVHRVGGREARVEEAQAGHLLVLRGKLRVKPHEPVHRDLQRVVLGGRLDGALEVPDRVRRHEVPVAGVDGVGVAALECDTAMRDGAVLPEERDAHKAALTFSSVWSWGGIATSRARAVSRQGASEARHRGNPDTRLELAQASGQRTQHAQKHIFWDRHNGGRDRPSNQRPVDLLILL